MTLDEIKEKYLIDVRFNELSMEKKRALGLTGNNAKTNEAKRKNIKREAVRSALIIERDNIKKKIKELQSTLSNIEKDLKARGLT